MIKSLEYLNNPEEHLDEEWIGYLYNTRQIINPQEHLSYQLPEKPFEISEEDFKKTAIDYICFKNGIDTKEFADKLLNSVLYYSDVTTKDKNVNIRLTKGGDLNGKN